MNSRRKLIGVQICYKKNVVIGLELNSITDHNLIKHCWEVSDNVINQSAWEISLMLVTVKNILGT